MVKFEIQKIIQDWVEKKVRQGFETRESIIEETNEMIKEEHGEKNAISYITKITDEKLIEHHEKQKTWDEITDCDKIDLIFNLLEEKGIVARQNFTCCQTCGNYEIGEEIENYKKKQEPIGYTFYNYQDTERVIEDGTIYLSYGSISGEEQEILEIGKIISKTIQENGLKVEWNNSTDKRIAIVGLDWKKRRHKSSYT